MFPSRWPAGRTTVPVSAAAEILHINWILFFPGQSSTALFIQRAGKTATQKRQGRVAPQVKAIYIIEKAGNTKTR